MDQSSLLAAGHVREQWDFQSRLGMILGTGLGELAEGIECEARFVFADLPGFANTTAPGHAGRLLCGRLKGLPVVALAGRLHRYEGYNFQQLTQGVRLLRAMGVHNLLLCNASGGLNPELESGDVLVIEDHLDMMQLDTPWFVAPEDREQGLRPQARLGNPYFPDWIPLALDAAHAAGRRASAGCYAALSGPNYETRAEYRMLRRLGADVVGMSTVPEAHEALRQEMRVLALSAVSNVADPDVAEKVTAENVISLSQAAQPTMEAIVHALVDTLI